MKQVIVNLRGNEITYIPKAKKFGFTTLDPMAGIALFVEDGKINYNILPGITLPKDREDEARKWIAKTIVPIYTTEQAWDFQTAPKMEGSPLYGVSPDKNPEKWLTMLNQAFTECSKYEEQKDKGEFYAALTKK